MDVTRCKYFTIANLRWCGCLVVLVILSMSKPVSAVTHLTRGMEAPAIELRDLAGAVVNTKALEGKTLVLIFGELYHDPSLKACEELAAILESESLRNELIMPILIVAQNATDAQLRETATDKTIPSVILHDTARDAYEAYRVAVLPSVVVVDTQGRVVHVIAAYTSGFSDVLTDALLLAVGQIDVEMFERRLHAEAVEVLGTDQIRAQRLTQLAAQLSRRGMEDMAVEKYQEVLELQPQYTPAHLGLGVIQLKRHRLTEAEQAFRLVLEQNSSSINASIGLAFIQTLRGGEELVSAEQLVQQVLAKQPEQPRAQYLMGLIYEKQGLIEEACSRFKKSSEILLQQTDWE